MKTIKIAGVPEHFNLPWHLCIENGEFENVGIDLHWTDVPEGTGKMCQMLREGETDIAVILTEGIVKDIQHRFSNSNVFWLPNGVDIDFYNPEKVKTSDFRSENGFSTHDILFFYGGIIGHAQGLEVILLAAKEVIDIANIHFILQGSGPEKEKLINLNIPS